VLLMTATPHDGDRARFARLLQLGRLPTGASDDADDRLLPLPDFALYDPEGGVDLLLTHGPERRADGRAELDESNELVRRGSLGFALGQPLLTTSLRFPLLGLFPDAGLLVVPPPLQFAEEPFPRELLLRNFERFFDVVIEDFNFHACRLCTFSGDACPDFLRPTDRPGGGV